MPDKIKLALFYILSFTWGILMTLVGLFILLFTYLFMHDRIVIRVIAGRIAITFKDKIFGGLSLGIVYLVDKGDGVHTHVHELGHTLQNAALGPLFILLIAIPSAIRYHIWDVYSALYYTRHGHFPGYDDIWFEHQATSLGERHYLDKVKNKLRR